MAKRRASGEGNIRKRKDGRWEGRYTAGHDSKTGKPISKNVLGKTQAEVKEKLKRAIADAEKLDFSKAGQYTVGQWMDVWFENYAKVKVRPSSHQTYQGYIEHHIKPRIGGIPLEKLTTLDLQKLYKELLEDGRVVRKESEKQPKGLSPKTVRICRQVARINGEIVEAPLKTKNSYRTISLGDGAIEVLKEQEKKTDDAYVFPSPNGGPISPDSVQNMLNRVLKRAGLPKIRVHDLRHTFATLALQNGVDIKTVSGMLGHYSAGFTLDTYTHVTTPAQIEAANTMGSVLAVDV